MAKKELFWQRKKEYYQFPLWMRVIKTILSAGWTVIKIGIGAAVAALCVLLVAGAVFTMYMGDYLQ